MIQTIEIPMLPPRALSPNGRAHWAVKRKAAEPMKQVAALQGKQLRPISGPATVTVTFIVAQNRRRDGDNWLASMKPVMDVLVQTGLFTDDDSRHISYAPVRFEVDKHRAPMTVLEISEEQIATT